MRSARRTFALSFGALLLLAAACSDGDATIGEGAPEPTGNAMPDGTLGDGEQVTVTGTVQDVLADTAFTLTGATVDGGTVGTGGEIGVIVPEGDPEVSASEEVVVTGTLHSLDVAEGIQDLEDLLGVDVDDEALARFDGQQIVLASSVGEGG